MQINTNHLIGHSLDATDGEIGKVETFYFDDDTWTIRYFVVKTGGWLLGHKVLISPQALSKGPWTTESLPVNLTKEQVGTSPDIDTDKPVSRQQEAQLYSHYPWQNYWGGGLYAGGIWDITYPTSSINNPMAKEAEKKDMPSGDDLHLRSTDEVAGYHVHATDGDIGHVQEFIMDDKTWKILFFVVDTHNWFGGKKVLIPVSDIKEVQWENSKVIFNITTDAVKASKPFNELEFNYPMNIFEL